MPSVSAPVIAAIVPPERLREAPLPDATPAPGTRWSDGVVFDVWRFVLDRGGSPFDPAARNTLDGLGLYGFALQTAPTGMAAVDTGARLFPLISDRGGWRREGDLLSWHTASPAEDPAVASDASTVAHFAAGMVALCGSDAVREVRLRWSSPRGLDWLRALGIHVRLGTDDDAIAIGALSRPPRAHAALHDHLVAQADAELRGLPNDLVELVRRAIAQGATRPQDAARRLALAPRTLRRRLAEAGRSFSALVDEHRRAEARRLVRRGDALVEIADALEFSDATALSRAYRRWYGVAPSRDRRA